MKHEDRSRQIGPIRPLLAACGVFVTLSLAVPGLAQQVANGPSSKTVTAKSPAAEDAESPSNTLASTPLSPFLPAFASQRPAARASAKEEGSPKSNTPSQQGVKVHGHWVLQVKNPDGTLGDRREFDNSLVTTNNSGNENAGSSLMVAMLSGNVAVGAPGIGFIQGPPAALGSGGIPDACITVSNDTAPAGVSCFVFTTGASGWGENNTEFGGTQGINIITIGLQSQASFLGTNPNVLSPAIVLSGNYTVPAGLTLISAVQSLWGLCAPVSAAYLNSPIQGNLVGPLRFSSSVLEGTATFGNADESSKTCSSGATSVPSAGQGGDNSVLGALTGTLVTPSAMAVTPGQIVQVSVTITFS
jgi:hypothetical protein